MPQSRSGTGNLFRPSRSSLPIAPLSELDALAINSVPSLTRSHWPQRTQRSHRPEFGRAPSGSSHGSTANLGDQTPRAAPIHLTRQEFFTFSRGPPPIRLRSSPHGDRDGTARSPLRLEGDAPSAPVASRPQRGRLHQAPTRGHYTFGNFAIWASRLARSRSASTMILTSSLNLTLGSQPSFSRALAGSPISSSTSAGRS